MSVQERRGRAGVHRVHMGSGVSLWPPGPARPFLPAPGRTPAEGDAVVTLGRAQSPVRPLTQREPWMCPSRSPTFITLMKQLLALLAEVL